MIQYSQGIKGATMRWYLSLSGCMSFFLLYSLAQASVAAPELKWSYGGCYSSWCETGWYSSPAVADLDGDGKKEVIGSAYSIVSLDGETGKTNWRVASGHDRANGGNNVGRTWPGIVVTDVDGDLQLEIVTAHGGGYVSVYDHNGYFQSGWPRRPVSNELRGLVVDDMDDDGTDEIMVTGAVYGKVNTWVYEHSGKLRSGWPQLSNDSGYSYGVFNDNGWMADISGDSDLEVIVPSDVHYICAYSSSGRQLAAHSIYGGKGWGRLGCGRVRPSSCAAGETAVPLGRNVTGQISPMVPQLPLMSMAKEPWRLLPRVTCMTVPRGTRQGNIQHFLSSTAIVHDFTVPFGTGGNLQRIPVRH